MLLNVKAYNANVIFVWMLIPEIELVTVLSRSLHQPLFDALGLFQSPLSLTVLAV
jgi:hypothetical protein